MNPADEAAFEEHIASWLVEHGGYQRVKVGNAGGEPRDFDVRAGVDTADLFEFIVRFPPNRGIEVPPFSWRHAL